MSQIIGLVYINHCQNLKLIKWLIKIRESVSKREEMEKDEEGEELISQSREQEQEYKEGLRSISHLREIRWYWKVGLLSSIS